MQPTKTIFLAIGMTFATAQKKLTDVGLSPDDVTIVTDAEQMRKEIKLRAPISISISATYSLPDISPLIDSGRHGNNKGFKPYRNKMTRGRK